jgi:predicted neutral ceramidase superfamily lipid hydrolase
MVVSLITLRAIFTQSYDLAYIRPYQLMAFADILIILSFLLIYLITNAKTPLYVVELALAALIPINYLDIYTRTLQGVHIAVLPFFIKIEGLSGSSLALDLGQISILALAILYMKNIIGRKSGESNIQNI